MCRCNAHVVKYINLDKDCISIGKTVQIREFTSTAFVMQLINQNRKERERIRLEAERNKPFCERYAVEIQCVIGLTTLIILLVLMISIKEQIVILEPLLIVLKDLYYQEGLK